MEEKTILRVEWDEKEGKYRYTFNGMAGQFYEIGIHLVTAIMAKRMEAGEKLEPMMAELIKICDVEIGKLKGDNNDIDDNSVNNS